MNRLLLQGWVALLTGLIGGVCQAGGLSVSPMRLDFSAARGINLVTLTNTSRETLTVEAEVQAWPADAAGQSARDLVVNPPISTLGPGERATVRIGLVKRLGNEVERGYRVYFTELPSLRPQDAVGIGVRLRLGIPAFVAAASPRLQPLEWSVGRDGADLVLTAHNPGNVHHRVTRLSTQRGTGQLSAAQSSPYVMPGGQTTFRMPGLTAGAGDALLLKVQSDEASQQVEVRVP